VNRQRRLACVAFVAVVATRHAWAQQGPETLSIDGDVAKPLVLTVQDLRGLPAQHVEDKRGDNRSTGESASPRRYTGVRLRELLDRAQPKEREPRGLRKSYVVASASDGYQVVFSWAELYLSPIGDGVLVVYERDGAPLRAGEGPIALVSLADSSPGPRHVKWLRRIELRAIAP